MNRFPAAAWLCLLLFSPSAHADPLALPDVLARYRAAVGPKPSDTAAFRTTGTEETGGLTGTYVTIESGTRYWTGTKIGIYDDVDATDGTVYWHKDSNGGVRLLSSDDLRDRRTDEAVDHDEFTRDGFKGKVTLRPQTDKRTGDYVLDVVPDGGNPVTLFLDPQTFLLARQERDRDGTLYIITYSGYRKMAGQMQPTTFRTHADKSKGKFDDVTTVDAIADAPQPDPSLFAVPAPTKNYDWTTPGATSATLPFDDADNSIAVYCVINGHPTYLELDSGTGGLALAKVAADRLGLPHQGAFQGSGYGGTVEDAPVLLDTLELVGGVVIHNVSAYSLAVEQGYANYQAVDTVGLLGYPLLSRFVVKVDYAAGQVTLTEPDSFTPTPATGTPLPLGLDNNLPTVTASLDGMPPARFLVDTGDAMSAVHLYSPYVRAHSLSAAYPKGMNIFGRGVGGTNRARRVRAVSFSVAGSTLKDVPTDLSLDTQGMGAATTLAGALGHTFLSRFAVTFDYPHGRIFFAPTRDTQKPFDTRTFGVYVRETADENNPNTRIKFVSYVENGSPAARAGLRGGEILEQIDGQDAAKLDMGTVRRMLSAEGGRGTRRLTVTVTSRGVGVINSQFASTSDVKIALYDPVPSAGDHK